jgi:REP element-mobilizing transposase RayT
MSRQRRKLSSSQIYHIMLRGNSGRDIFIDDEDRHRFLNILTDKKKDNEFVIYAYCLMDNHIHLLLKENKDNISHIMKRIGTAYAVYFNKKYQQNGHLFQDRFKSEVIEGELYLLAVIRYIHNNPLKARLVKLPEDYKWCSYSEYLKNRTKMVIVEDILKLFSKNLSKALPLFMQFSQAEDNHDFLEYKEDNQTKKDINTYQKASNFRDQYLKRNHLELILLRKRRNKIFRDKLIRELKEKSVLSNREIAILLEINRGIVQLVKL